MAILLVRQDQLYPVLSKLQDEMRQVIAEYMLGEFTYEDLEVGLHHALAHLWIYHNNEEIRAWAVTRFGDYAKKRRLVIDLLGGKGIDIWSEEGLAVLESWGRTHGAVEIEARVRPGYARYLAKHGFVDPYRFVVKEIPQGVH